MEQAMRAKENGVAFRRPTFQRSWSRFWKGVWRQLELTGYARAAAELSRQGRHEEAKALMLDYIVKKES